MMDRRAGDYQQLIDALQQYVRCMPMKPVGGLADLVVGCGFYQHEQYGFSRGKQSLNPHGQ